MQLIVYTNPADNSAGLLQNEISKMPLLQAEFVHNHENLMQALRSHMVFRFVVVFQAAGQKDFIFLKSIKNILFDARLILVLPNREKDTIEQGCSLYPRFITYADSDHRDVTAVLNKMLIN